MASNRFGAAFRSLLPAVLLCGALGSAQSSVQNLGELKVHDLLFDHVSAGEIWALGRDYKAHFGPRGLSFVPFFGSQAPRNFPVVFAVQEVRVGERELPLRLESAPQRFEGLVSYDRGSFTELFLVEPRSVEQRFRFGRLDAEGDLVLRIAFASELSAREHLGGILFEGEWGSVRYGEVLALDGDREVLRTAPRLIDGAIEIRIPRSTLAQLHGPLTIDPLITTFDLVTTNDDDREPDICYDASLGVYVVVFRRVFSQADSDVLGLVLDGNGGILRQFGVEISDMNAHAVYIAGIDALDQFLVTFRNGAITGWVHARFVELSGADLVVGPLTGLWGGTRSYAIGGDAGSAPPFFYFTASEWSGDHYLDYKFIRPDGEIHCSDYFFNNWDDYYSKPRIAKSGGGPEGEPRRWSLAFEHREPATPVVMTTRFAADCSYTPWSGGGVTGPDVSSRLEGAGSAIPGGDMPHLVTYVTGNGTGQVQARRMQGSATQGTLTVHMPTSTGVRVETDGSSFVIGWTELTTAGLDERIYLASAELSGSSIQVAEKVQVSSPGRVSRGVSLASTLKLGGAHQRAMAVWYEMDQGKGDIVGALYELPGPGLPYCIAAPNSVGPGARIDAAGSISLSAGTFELSVEACPPSTLGIFYIGQNAIELPFGDGWRCLGGVTRRILPPLTTDGAGRASLVLDFSQPYGDIVFSSPDEISYQFWYRDPAGGPSHFNLSDALRVQHLP